MTSTPLLNRLTSKGPKRILALDGGGIRAALTLGFLERIEEILRHQHHKPDLKLSDYFDLIGGTSTGAIIASGLAVGMEVAAIKQLYLDLGGKVFGKTRWRKWEALFDPAPLKQELSNALGDKRLDDAAIKTGLCIIIKRADTGGTWPLLNHPHGRYYSDNRRILLRDAVRASTAAPVYFVPEKIDVGGGVAGAFVDGGVSMANNPALQLFLVATLQGYPFHWQTGEDRLLLVSAGTGVWKPRNNPDVVAKARLWDWAREVPAMLMGDASWHNQLILQSMSRTPTPWKINEEVGDLSSDLLTERPLLSYLRYNCWLESEALQELGLDHLIPKLKLLREMSAAECRYDLALIGAQAAPRQVREEHFSSEFKLSQEDFCNRS
jgi:hypothetical protein